MESPARDVRDRVLLPGVCLAGALWIASTAVNAFGSGDSFIVVLADWTRVAAAALLIGLGLYAAIVARRAGARGIPSEAKERALAEEALRDSEQVRRTITDNSTDYILLLDPNATIRFINRTVPDLTSQQVIGTSVLDYVPERCRRTVSECLARVRATHQPDEYETEYDGIDGAAYFESRVAPVIRNGEVVAMTVVARDVTERRASEEALRQSEEMRRSIIDNSFDHIVMIDRNGIIKFINRGAIADSVDEYIGRSVFEILPERSHQAMRESYQRVFETGEPDQHEVEHDQPDGTVFSFEAIAAPIVKDGEVVALTIIARDITKRKQMEQALRESEQKHRALVEQIPAITYVAELDSGTVFVSPQIESLLGFTAAEWMARPSLFLEQMHPDDREHVSAAVSETHETGKALDLEYRLLARDGSVKWFHDQATVITDEGGCARLHQGVMYDISARKQAEEALRKSESKFRRVVDSNMVGILFWNADGGIRDANDIFLAMVGYSREDLEAGRVRWNEMTPPEYVAQDQRALKEIADTGTCTPFEKEYLRKDGSRVPVLLGAANLEGSEEDGVCFVIDMTELRKVEQQRARAESKYQTLFEQSPDAIVIIDPETTLPIEFNDGGPQLLGYSREEFARMRVSDYEAVESPEEVRARAARLLETGREQFETKMRTKSGDIIDVVVSVRVTELNGRPVSHNIFRDITQRKRFEEALRISEERFRHMFEESPVGMDLVTPDLRIIRANAALCRMLGYEEEEVIGRCVYDFLHPDDVQPTKDLTSRVTDGDLSHVHIERRYLTKDGRVAWANLRGAPIRDDDGQVLYGIAVIENIDDRKRAEEALLNIARGFSTKTGARFFESMVMHLATSLDAEYAFIGELIGPGRVRATATYAEGEMIEGPEYDLEGTPCQHVMHAPICSYPRNVQQAFPKDEFLVEMGAEAYVGMPLYDSTGEPMGLLAVLFKRELENTQAAESMLNIFGVRVGAELERMRAESALYESMERYRATFEQAPVGIASVRASGSVLALNDWFRQVLGYERDELIGRPIQSITHPEDVEICMLNIGQMLSGAARTCSMELRYLKKDGSIVWVDATGSVKCDEEGKPEYAITVARDITDRKHAQEEHERIQEQLAQSRRLEAIGTLAAGVAHDINNTLTVISGYTDIARRAARSKTEIEAIEGIEHASNQAAGIAKSLLTFGRRSELDQAHCRLDQTVEHAVRLVQRMLPANVRVETDIASSEALVLYGSESELQQVVLNLALNARDAMPDGGRMRIVLRHEPPASAEAASSPHGHARLIVEDDGAGMAPEVAERMFDPFFSTKPRDRGSGLGLSIVHGIVRDHDGHISIKTSPGEGTRISISLPCKPPPDASADDPGGSQTRRGNNECVLVAEDDRQVLAIVSAALQSANFTVLPSRSGPEAVDLFTRRADAVSLLVLDVSMPGMNGLECLRRIRDIRDDVPAIIITGNAGGPLPDDKLTGVSVLYKPFSMRALVDATCTAVQQHADGA